NVNEEESMNLTSIIVIILVVVAVIGLLALGVFLFKRKIKERSSFFNTSHNGYYVFRDIDESVYYFTPEQYAKMYTANSLVTYKYLGQAARKGGPILGVGQSQNPQLQTFDAQPIAAAPIVGQPLSSGQEIVPDNNPGPPNQMFPEGTVPGSGYGAQVPGIGTQEIPGSISTVPETTGQLPSEEISTSVPQKIGQEGYEMEQPFQSDAAIGQDENVQNQQIPADDGTNSLPVNKEDGILDPQET
ncbi:MAG: hypothetical protein U9R75_06555, partial [Candidatus Thermoplasmatota archaeon]|nr:hypothetical protein [Candidatus Thermoplasmatota archaeon]